MKRSGMRIAMVGQRGVPATWGGIEHHVEELSARLVARGHLVTVFCRAGYVDQSAMEHRRIRLEHLPTVPTKHFDAFVHSGLATVRAVRHDYDVVHYHALGPGLFSFIPRMVRGRAVVQTVHGRDDRREKWGSVSQRILRFGGWLSARVPDATIAVSETLVADYARTYGRIVQHVPNGVRPIDERPPGAALARLGLDGDDYVLFVGRLVPEKAPDLLVRAFRRVPGDTKLVIVGGSSFSDGYVTEVRREASRDPRVRMPGFMHGAELDELYSNASLFVLPSMLEGLPLTLLEAASAGRPVVASAIPPHLEILGGDAPGRRLVPAGDEDALAAALARALGALAQEQAGARVLQHEISARYDWDTVAEQTETVYAGALARATRSADERIVNLT